MAGYFVRDAAPTALAFERDDTESLPRGLAADLGGGPKFTRGTWARLPSFQRIYPDRAVLDGPLDFPLG